MGTPEEGPVAAPDVGGESRSGRGVGEEGGERDVDLQLGTRATAARRAHEQVGLERSEASLGAPEAVEGERCRMPRLAGTARPQRRAYRAGHGDADGHAVAARHAAAVHRQAYG